MSPNAEPEVIQGAYRALMRKYHPDANAGASSDARAKRINEAYATLSNPGSRAAYDAQLRAADTPPHPETVARSATPTEPADDFASTKPVRRAGGKMSGRTWVLATIATAIVGLVAGRYLASAPAHGNQAVSESGSEPPASPSPPSPVGGSKAGRAVSAARAVGAVVSGDIVPRWRPDCSAGNAVVDVQVNLAPNGSLISERLAGSAGDASQLAAATEKAEQAVVRAAPFALPRESYRQWRLFIVRFDTKDVCG